METFCRNLLWRLTWRLTVETYFKNFLWELSVGTYFENLHWKLAVESYCVKLLLVVTLHVHDGKR